MRDSKGIKLWHKKKSMGTISQSPKHYARSWMKGKRSAGSELSCNVKEYDKLWAGLMTQQDGLMNEKKM